MDAWIIWIGEFDYCIADLQTQATQGRRKYVDDIRNDLEIELY